MLTELMTNPSLATIFVIFLWGSVVALMLIKQEWFFNFEARFPKISAFDRIIFTDVERFIFLVARTIVLFVVLYILGMFIILLFS